MEKKKSKKKYLALNMWPNEEISGWDELIWEITGTYLPVPIMYAFLLSDYATEADSHPSVVNSYPTEGQYDPPLTLLW